MRRAIALSKRGFPAPNPHVGCVIVRDGEIVGEGFHAYAGGPHAEAAALAVAGERARGADVYVTLEPCNHFGRTPPCALALKNAHVRRVVFACSDPNPRATGGGAELERAGILVEKGLLQAEAEAANERFLTAMALRRPHVTVKAALSLDGRIALPTGESQWITGDAARKLSHRLRADCGAVLVGRRTVEADDPSLTARIPKVVNQPLRIVLDPSGRLDSSLRVFDDSAPTKHVTGRIDLPQLLRRLFDEGVTSLLVEGGGATIGGFVRAGLVDRFELFVAPKILGDGPAWIHGLQLSHLADAPPLEIERIRRVGSDLHLCARVASKPRGDRSQKEGTGLRNGSDSDSS